MSYFSLHLHTDRGSNALFLDSTVKPKDAVKRAKELGLLGLCCTDHASISAWVDFLAERDEIKKNEEDFKIMLGVEAYLIDEAEYKNTKDYYHFLLIAKDDVGRKQLFELTSKAWDRSYMERGVRRVPIFYQDIEALEEKGHLVASSACLGGRIPKLIMTQDKVGVGRFLSWCVRNFGKENFFLEIQPNDHSEEQILVNRALIKISQQTKIPYIITTDVHYTNKEQKQVHEAFLNSREARGVRETSPFYDYTYLMDPEEIYDVMGNMGMTPQEVYLGLENTKIVASLVEDFDFRGDTVVPQRALPQFKLEHLLGGWYNTHPTIKYFSEGEYDQDLFLLYLVEQGIKSKKITIGKTEADRIETEFDVLKCLSEAMGQRMSAYLNLVQEIVDVGWNVSFVGVSRGSACSYYINYLIGITQLNPISYDIPYWRFLNKASATPGASAASTLADVDLDFSPEKDKELMDLFREHYGQDCVINTLTFKTESLKSAVKTACRGLGINNDEAQTLSSMVPMSRGHVYTLDECENGNEEQDYAPTPQFISELHSHEGLYETVKQIEGLVSGVSQHASAVYWCQGTYLNYCGAMRTPRGTKITCFDYRGMDQCHGLKIDILFTDVQTKLMKCIELMLNANVIQWQGSLRATYNKYLHPDVLVYDDEAMWDAMADGKIPSLFQFDTQVGSVCIKRTRPQNVKQLAAANAVMRLMNHNGTESPLDRFVRFRNDIGEWYREMDGYGLTKDEQEVLKEELSDSFGVGPHQEEMMRLVQRPEIANFTLAEAGKIRKGISKKRMKVIDDMKKRFFEEDKNEPS